MNKRILKLLFSMIFVMFSISLIAAPVVARDDIRVVLNGTVLTFDVPPQIINERVMVPMRAIFEALGADVYWDEIDDSQLITSVKNDVRIVMWINEHKLIRHVGHSFDAFLKDFLRGGISIDLDVSPQLINGRTLVPLRAISEALGIEVDWDSGTNTVILSCDKEFIENKNKDETFHGEFIAFYNAIGSDDLADYSYIFDELYYEINFQTKEEPFQD